MKKVLCIVTLMLLPACGDPQFQVIPQPSSAGGRHSEGRPAPPIELERFRNMTGQGVAP